VTRVPGCTGKCKYATRELAVEASSNYGARIKLHTYQCPVCHCWHVSGMSLEEAKRNHAAAAMKRQHNADLVQRLLKERGIAPKTHAQGAARGGDPGQANTMYTAGGRRIGG
jgi:hypothetical protein